MSRSPFFFVEKFDYNTNKYELQHPIIWNHNHTKQVAADLFPYNGDHDLFSIVEDKEDNFPHLRGIHYGLPRDVSSDIKEAYDECCYNIDCDKKIRHEPNAHWFTYADMYIYCIENPTAIDYEAMDREYLYNNEESKEVEKIYMETPLKRLKERVDAFLEVMDEWGWEEDYSQIRIVYWIE